MSITTESRNLTTKDKEKIFNNIRKMERDCIIIKSNRDHKYDNITIIKNGLLAFMSHDIGPDSEGSDNYLSFDIDYFDDIILNIFELNSITYSDVVNSVKKLYYPLNKKMISTVKDNKKTIIEVLERVSK